MWKQLENCNNNRSRFMIQDKYYEVSWENFAACNQNPQESFEKMCRWLFNNFFFNGKALFHSEPNNPGVEVVPKLHPASNKRISFQAKYFSTMDYEQIKRSAKKAVKHYGDELDVIYLYCNKDVTTSSKSYKDIEKILKTKSIEIIPITNQEILEQVMKNETIACQYFNYFTLSQRWFKEQLESSLALLGPRFNDKFNVATQSERYLNEFICNPEGAKEINNKKNGVIQKLKNERYKYSEYKETFESILNAICELEDVTPNSILECLIWADKIEGICSEQFKLIDELIDKKKNDKERAHSENKKDILSTILSDIEKLTYLRDVPTHISPDSHEQLLLKKQVLIVNGDAGVGKSQMFAVATEKLVEENRGAVLLLGSNFLSNNPVNTQILEVLSLTVSLDTFFHKLEALGIENNTYSCIFLDAINESTYKNIWQIGLFPLIAKIKNFPHVKLAVSIRTGYERLVLNDAINNAVSNEEIVKIVHTGFREESITATFTFLNYYGIPFSPAYFLQSEMTNPLFLKLFCETYSGENYDMFTLFDKLIEKADKEAQQSVGIQDGVPILQNLIDEMAYIRLTNKSLTVSQSDLFSLDFWDKYGLSSQKIPFVTSLQKSGLLIGMVYDGTESYYLAYNLLEDFVCAKAIINHYNKESDIVEYLQNELLQIKDGKITNYNNVDIFIVVCGLFADKYYREIFTAIDKLVTDEIDSNDISRNYLESFLWRKASSVNSTAFLEFINNHYVEPETVFRVLIENSTKEKHPLNSLFLHNILISKSIAHRDALWTTYINGLTYDDERIYQLVNYFDKGKVLDGLSDTNTELILILFGWLLTSSNRFLRDKTSKAMIELLKRNFTLCEKTLKHFETVDDSYVLQRLYAIIFGACIKRTQEHKEIYRSLVKYVYQQIFNKEYVYPDILLRDYARLIIERWKHEYSDDCDFFDSSKISPPYRSIEIPVVEKQEYYDMSYNHPGFNSIVSSMMIDHSDVAGIYGDFGRYVFQSALRHFNDVDIVNLYHYAMQSIRDELNYNDALDRYDSSYIHRGYFRNDTKKIERIGKKYEWITLYNILARVSDTHELKNWDECSYPFEGPWEPYVRDFDPTLNVHFLNFADIPSVEYPKIEEGMLPIEPYPSINDIQKWTQTNTPLFESIPSQLSSTDINGNRWIALYLYNKVKNNTSSSDTNSIGFSKGSQQIWDIVQSCFIRTPQLAILKKHTKNYLSTDFPTGADTYQLFNREYAWSPGYNNIFREMWIDCELDIGEYRIIKEKYQMPDYEHLEYDEEGNMILPYVEKEFEKRIPEDTLHIEVMPSYSRFVWEGEYDASQDKATSFYVPCKDLIQHLNLEQKQSDSYYCTKDGELVCFDGNLCGICDGLMIRADYLNKYLQENGVEIFWTCIGEKQFFTGDMSQKWSSWKGLYFLENGIITGNIESYEQR